MVVIGGVTVAGLLTLEPTAAVPTPPGVHGSAVDAPLPGSSVDAGAIEVIGWVVGAEAPVAAVEIVDGTTVLARERVGIRRPDLARAFPSVPWAATAGYRAAVGFRRPASEVRLGIQAALHDGTVVHVSSVRGRRTWRNDPIEGTPLVSVVIPCYNQAHFLRDAIESVVAQTYPHVEAVIIDDGSADNTEAVVNEYDGVRCVRQENAGLAGARNTGIRHTVGPFLVFLDADDRLLPEAIQTGLECFRHDPAAAFVYGSSRWVGTDGSPVFTPEQLCSDEPYLALLEMCGIIPGAVMFRRAVFDGGRGFDPSVDASADWDMYLTVARELPVRCHGRTVLEYRRHGGNMTNDASRILEAEMVVLRRHRREAEAVLGGPRAAVKGMRRSREVHGPAVVEQVRRAVSTGDTEAVATGLRLLARYYPAGLSRLLRRRS